MTKKFKKMLAFLLSAIIVMLNAPSEMLNSLGLLMTAKAAEMTQPSGEGTSASPYKIGTAAELYWFANYVNSNNLNAYAELTNDIDLKGNDSNQWTPIGGTTKNSAYRGTFDGKNHTIKGLYFNDTNRNNAALFTFVSGKILNLTIDSDSYINAKNYVGGICAYNNGGTIENCINKAKVVSNGSNDAGGICSYSSGGKVFNCVNEGDITGYDSTGGVCGGVDKSGTVEKCYNKGDVVGRNQVGGISGYIYGTMKNCYNNGDITGGLDEGYIGGVGGICGRNSGDPSNNKYSKITNCYSNGKITGNKNVAGVCGINSYNENIISNSYYDSTVYSGGTAVAVIGNTSSNMVSVADTDDVCGKESKSFTGGEVAYLLQNGDDGDIWGQDLTVNDSLPAFNGIVIYKKCDGISYTNNANDVKHSYIDGICENCHSYKMAELSEDSSYYKIENKGNLYWFASYVNKDNASANAKLINDIKLNSDVFDENGKLSENTSSFEQWVPIGTNSMPYKGTFDGNGKIISGLYLNSESTDYAGLFGYIGENGNVSKVGVCDSYIKGKDNVGGICGYNLGEITSTYYTGEISASSIVGGLFGYNGGNVANGYSIAKLSGSSTIGGVCGQNEGTINSLYYDNTAYCDGSAVSGAEDTSDVCGKAKECFFSGEVAYLLQKSDKGATWGQDLSAESSLPKLNGLTIYKSCGSNVYSNDSSSIVHSYNDDGICEGCHDYKPAKLSEDSSYYKIENKGNLYWFANYVNKVDASANAKLINNIELNSNIFNEKGELSEDTSNFEQWTPIGNGSVGYTGTFDGNGKTISGLYFNNESTNYAGLFGYVSKSGAVYNVGVANSYIKGSDYVGGVFGKNDGITKNCYSSSEVSGSNYVGGVCGYNNGTITSCYNNGKVSGTDNVGGVCGYNNGTIKNCYNNSDKYNGKAIGYSSSELNNVLNKATKEFESGEVCYLLQSGQEKNAATGEIPMVWGQTIGTDKAPVLTNDSARKVYSTTGCEIYSNTEPEIKEKAHNLGSDLKCTDCGKYDKPVLNKDVYEISNASQLYWFAEYVNSGNTSANAILKENIVVNENVLDADGKLNKDTSRFVSWTPIGSESVKYAGKFDGNGKTISGLYFNNDSLEEVGLFGYVSDSGDVSNVGVVDSYIKGSDSVGGVCGWNLGTITNCYNNGIVSGNNFVGGVCGLNNGTIKNCYNNGAVSGNGAVGGVCGGNSGTIKNCYNNGAVSGSNEVGGVCGRNSGTIKNCYNNGAVSGDVYVGGVCGDNRGTIKNCYNNGAVSGSARVGGVCGVNSGTITSCYNNSDKYNGNAIGYSSSELNNVLNKATKEFKSGEVCYLLQSVQEKDDETGEIPMVWGQTIGTDKAPVLTNDSKRKVYVTKNCVTYTNDEKKSDVEKEHGSFENGICSDCGKYDKPVLNKDVYEISNAGQLYWFAEYVNSENPSANAILKENIEINKNVLDADGKLNKDTSRFVSWTPIGSETVNYAGKFDGNGKTISGLYFNNGSTNYVGLFGYVSGSGAVSNVGVVNSYIKGSSSVGGVCGKNEGTITSCYNNGAVSGSYYVGGVCGANNGTIKNCYNNGIVSGHNYVGGVCGANNGTIKNCYNNGAVSGDAYVGGVCGENESTITSCYYNSDKYNGYAIGLNRYGEVNNVLNKATKEFKSGEVCYLLQSVQEKNDETGEIPMVWGQTIGTDKAPVLTNDSARKVYNTTGCETYSNTEPEIKEKAHNFGSDLKCTDCGKYDKPVLNKDVYEISNASQLYWFAEYVNSGNTSANAILKENIVVNENVLDADGKLNEDTSRFVSWTPIGNNSVNYAGKFDGNGKTISGLYFNNDSTDYVGLFGYVSDSGDVSNVGVVNSYIKGSNYVGGVCGWNNGTIKNCYNNGAVSGSDFVGGVCGVNEGTITNCYNNGAVSGSFVGGVCGVNEGTIKNCYNNGAVSGSDRVGGVCGENRGTITSCYNNSDKYNGNAIGYDNGGEVNNVLNKATKEFESGEVCYLLQSGQEKNAETDEIPMVWGQTIGTDKAPVLTNDSERKVYVTKNCVTYTNDEKKSDVEKGHSISENGICSDCGKYEEPVPKGDVYEISNAGQLYWFAQYVNSGNTSANAILTENIVVNKNVLDDDGKLNEDTSRFVIWTPIGSESVKYAGKFDGNGKTISGLYFNNDSSDYVGLFGYVSGSGDVSNVGVVNSYIKGQQYVGGVCGYNKGTIKNCYNNGAVSGNIFVGGVCGGNSGTIKNCYNNGAVSGKNHVGGVCGDNSGTIKNCYNNGAVSGDAYVGGVCGWNFGTITNCYNNSDKYNGKAIGYSSSELNNVLNKAAKEFKSGEVCYLLQSGQEKNAETDEIPMVWGQTIGDDEVPVLTNDSERKVYVTKNCVTYTNDEDMSDVEKEHGSFENGICSDCSAEYKAAELKGDVYEISNAGQLYWFAQYVNSGNPYANAILKENIEINKNVLDDNGKLNEDTSGFLSWTPIGSESVKYAGKFDGNGKTISGLYFNNGSTDYVGLFGYVSDSGAVSNVGVVNSYIKGKQYVGGVCGVNEGTITSCYNNGAVSGSYVGGVCGGNSGTITSCYNNGAVSGSDSPVGGVCGVNSGTIKNCYNNGAVSGNNYVGGVCGENSGTIKNCYNNGAVSGSDYVGGVCGANYNTTTNCYNNSDKYSGDAIGYNDGGEVNNVLNKATKKFESGEVCYLLQSGQEKNDETDEIPMVWGQTIGTDKVPVLTNDSERKVYATKNCVTYTNDEDMSDVEKEHGSFENGICSDCGKYEEPVLNGDVYEISNASQLYWFAEYVNSGNTYANAILKENIEINKNVLDADGKLNEDTSGFLSWTPIGSESVKYAGKFDGNGKTISGLYFNNDSSNYVGLFGCVSDSGAVSNVGVVNSYIKGSNYVGGVCGWNNGTIKNCYNNGAVSGSDFVGGVCGFNYGTITNCYNNGAVSGSFVGGVCGVNNGTIKNCYNNGAVSGSFVGGVCGGNSGTIKNCYNNGAVSGSNYVGGVCGGNHNTTTNCYNNSDKYSGDAIGYNDGGEVNNVLNKTAKEFESGEVCYLLQSVQEKDDETGEIPMVWGQNLTGENDDLYPVFANDNNNVYRYISKNCNDEVKEPTVYKYGNDANKEYAVDEHKINNWICSDCNVEIGKLEVCDSPVIGYVDDDVVVSVSVVNNNVVVGDLSYQWYTIDGEALTAIEGAVNKEYTVPKEAGTANYVCVAKIGEHAKQSDVISVTVKELPFTIEKPVLTKTDKATISVKVNAKDNVTPTYQWYEVVSGNAVAVENANSSSYDIPKGKEMSIYKCKVSFNDYSKFSETISADKIKYTISVKSDNEELGSAAASKTEAYADEEVTVTATAKNGSTFLGWYDENGNVVSSELSYTFKVSKNVSLIAKFKANVSGDDKLMGDVNNDNVLTVADAVCVLQKVLDSKFKLPVEDASTDYMWYADVDNNKILTAADAAMILQKVLNGDFDF